MEEQKQGACREYRSHTPLFYSVFCLLTSVYFYTNVAVTSPNVENFAT